MSTLGRAAFGIVVGLALAGMAAAQSLTEFGAAAAGGTVGGAAGKKVSDGLTTILGKVDQQTKAAAKQDSQKQEKPASAPAASSVTASPAPAATASLPSPAAAPAPKPAPARKAAPAAKIASVRAASRPAVKREVKREEPVSVPDPPALHSAAVIKAAPPEPPPPPVFQPAPIPPPPPPPEVTADTLKSIAPGETRDDVLRLGPPSTRITMFGEDGHLVEIYTYMTKNTMLGVVRLNDGEVSKVELR